MLVISQSFGFSDFYFSLDSTNARYALSNAGEIEIQYNIGNESKEW